MIGLQLPHERDAVQTRQPPVREHHVYVFPLERFERLLSALDGQHLVARDLERAMEGAKKDFVVVDEQEPLLHEGPPTRGCATPTAGSEMRTRVPRPGELSMVMSPPCRSTIFLTMAMPSPVPDGLVVKNGRKILSRSPGAMPTPLSTPSTAARSSSASRLTTTRPPSPPAGIASSAFRMTLVKTWRSFCPSAAAITSRSTRP